MNAHRPAAPDPFSDIASPAGRMAENAAKTGRFAENAAKIQRLIDTQLPLVQKGPIACHIGCDYCCHRIVTATLPEIMQIADHVRNNFDEQALKEFSSRANELAQNLTEYYAAKNAHFREGCPFLVDHKCSIYEVRPVSCRCNLSPDAAACKKWLGGEMQPPMYRKPLQLLDSVDKAINSGVATGGMPAGTMELSGAVLTVLDQSQAALERAHGSAPIEKNVIRSPQNQDVFAHTEAFNRLADQAAFSDAWKAAMLGDTDQMARIIPALDPQTRLIADLALPSLYETQDELETWWAKLDSALTRLENAQLEPAEMYERLMLLNTFFWAYSGKDVRPPLERLMNKLRKDIFLPLFPELSNPLPENRKPGKFRLGYISGRLTNFNGSKWATGWLKHQDPEIETFAFNLWMGEDNFSNYWRRLADHYFHLPIPALPIANFIRSLDLDALIFTDVSMGWRDYQLTSFYLARRQFGAWGHPVTSGSETFEGYLSSAMMESAEADAHYREHLYRLPNSGLCYRRSETPVRTVDPGEFGLPAKGFYFNAQMASKNLPKHDYLFAEISQAAGKPVAFCEPYQAFNKAKMERRFKAAGMDFVIIPRLEEGRFIGLMAASDAILDTPSWHGGNSTIDALMVRKPVITMPTEFMRGRHGMAFLPLAGVGGLIARDADEYIRFALDLHFQQQVMSSLNAEALFEDAAPADALNKILLND